MLGTAAYGFVKALEFELIRGSDVAFLPDTQSFTSPCSRTVTSVTATADARNEVAESDEGNNSATARC